MVYRDEFGLVLIRRDMVHVHRGAFWSHCGLCGTPVQWGRNEHGQYCAADLESPDGKRYNHMETCPNAAIYRKAKP